MSELEDVRYGWDFMARMLGADVAGHSAFSDYMSNVAQNNAQLAFAQRPRRCNKLFVLRLHNRAAGDARDLGPPEDCQHDDNCEDGAVFAEHLHDHNRGQQERHREDNVGDAGENRVEDSPEETGQSSENSADENHDCGG